MPEAVRVEPITHGRAELCQHVIDSLPDWFGILDANQAYIAKVRELVVFAASTGGTQIGLLALEEFKHAAPEIHFMGVLPKYHRRGAGRELIVAASDWATARGHQLITVKTLSPAREDAGYRSTRLFYQSMGFLPAFELPNLWGPDNPCLLMVKPLH